MAASSGAFARAQPGIPAAAPDVTGSSAAPCMLPRVRESSLTMPEHPSPARSHDRPLLAPPSPLLRSPPPACGSAPVAELPPPACRLRRRPTTCPPDWLARGPARSPSSAAGVSWSGWATRRGSPWSTGAVAGSCGDRRRRRGARARAPPSAAPAPASRARRAARGSGHRGRAPRRRRGRPRAGHRPPRARTGRRLARAPAGVGPTNVVIRGRTRYATDTRGGALLVFSLRPRLELARRAEPARRPFTASPWTPSATACRPR